MGREHIPTGEILAWWLVPSNFRLANRDGRHATVGAVHEVKGSIRACGNGLHASQRLVDALGMCPKNCTQLFLVKLHGEMDGHNWLGDRYEKIAAQYRTYLAHITIDDAIRDICLNVIKQGVIENERRIIRYGADAGYHPIPKPIVDFAETGIISQPFMDALKGSFALDRWKRLREGIAVLMERGVTHEQLKATVALVSKQFGLIEAQVWKYTEVLVTQMMTDRVENKKLLPKGVTALLPALDPEVMAEQAAEIDRAIAAIRGGAPLPPALPPPPAEAPEDRFLRKVFKRSRKKKAPKKPSKKPSKKASKRRSRKRKA